MMIQHPDVLRTRSRSTLGASLVEVMGALAVMALVSAGLVNWIDQQQKAVRSQVAGQQLSLALQHAKLVNTALIAGQLLDAQNNPLTLDADNPVRAVVLPNAAIGNASFNATNGFGHHYCLVAERQVDGTVLSMLLTVGGEAMNEGQLSDAVSVAGPMSGRLNLNGAQWQGTALTWQRNLSGAVVNAVAASCADVVATGHLSALISNTTSDSLPGSGLYRVELPLVNATAKAELNTLQHDLSVRGDVSLGVGKPHLVGETCMLGTFARTSQGVALECLSASATWSVVSGSGSTLTANVLGVQATPSSQSKSGLVLGVAGALGDADNGQACSRVGAIRRDGEGGVVACQQPQNSSTGATWKREGGAVIKWVMLESPIDLLTSSSPTSDWSGLSISAAMSSIPNINVSKIRLVKLKFSNLYAASSSPSQTGPDKAIEVAICSNSPNVTTNIAVPSDTEMIADAKVLCPYNLWLTRASDGAVMPSTLGTPLPVRLQVMAYLCESENCQ